MDLSARSRVTLLFGVVSCIALAVTPAAAQAPRRTENVVLIVTDGVRWQELFRGPERRLLSRTPGGVSDTAGLIRDFWRDDPAQRRAAVFPFLWNTVAKQGVLYGNQDRGSVARITNRYKFSYPGYSELFTGFVDDRINSNDYAPNPNTTVFEWLAAQPGQRGRVGAVATWSAFRRILNKERAGIDVIDGWDEPFPGNVDRDAGRATLNALYRTGVRLWPDNAFDAPMHLVAKEYIRTRKPRVLFVGYGETDEWAHARRYDLVLRSAHQVDAFVADLWSYMQGMQQYRGRTTFIITTDHGRGGGTDDWTSHGERVDGAEDIWMAILGPDTPALGERLGGERVTQAQVAATIAALMGKEQEFLAASPKSALAVREAVSRPR